MRTKKNAFCPLEQEAFLESTDKRKSVRLVQNISFFFSTLRNSCQESIMSTVGVWG